MMRWFVATILGCMAAIVMANAVIEAVWPPDPAPLAIDGGGNAYTAQFIRKAKPLIIRPAPKPPPQPKRHRLKTNMEPFNRFEFDQRTIV